MNHLKAETRTITYINLKIIDKKKLKPEISTSFLFSNEYENKDIHEMTCLYDSTMQGLMDNHDLYITKKFTIKPYSPWFNDELRLLKHDKRMSERQFKKKSYNIKQNLFQ